MKTSAELFKREVRSVQAQVGLLSNNEELIFNPPCLRPLEVDIAPQIWNIATALHKVEEADHLRKLDGYLIVIDSAYLPLHISASANVIYLAGDIAAREATAQDKRWTLFGNLGLFFRYILSILETHHGIYSFHASSTYNPRTNELMIFVGGPGSGKTVLLLEGLLHQGHQLFSTEMTHVRLTRQGCQCYKGALFDNIRVGTLVEDFPEIIGQLSVDLSAIPDRWGKKYAVNLASYQTASDELVNPAIALIFPQIESGRRGIVINDRLPDHLVGRLLYNNLGEKLRESLHLYDGALVYDFPDVPQQREKRMHFVNAFMKLPQLKRRLSVLSGVQDCGKALMR